MAQALDQAAVTDSGGRRHAHYGARFAGAADLRLGEQQPEHHLPHVPPRAVSPRPPEPCLGMADVLQDSGRLGPAAHSCVRIPAGAGARRAWIRCTACFCRR